MKPKFEQRQKKFEYRMHKEKSVERTIWANLKPRNSWEEGLSINQLREAIIKEKKKKYTKQRIYDAISDMNRFGSKWGIYIKSDYGWIDKEDGKKKEFRYFTPKILGDIMREFDKLDDRRENVDLRETSLKYHQKVTIPQEQKLEVIRNAS